jgi:hypothetical protein
LVSYAVGEGVFQILLTHHQGLIAKEYRIDSLARVDLSRGARPQRLPGLHMRFFEFTSNNGNSAHVPVDQFLRIETFDDYQAGNGVVQVLFQNTDEENPYIVTINTIRGTQTSVASHIQGELSERSNDSILIRPNMMPNVTGIIF